MDYVQEVVGVSFVRFLASFQTLAEYYLVSLALSSLNHLYPDFQEDNIRPLGIWRGAVKSPIFKFVYSVCS
jgi:hypothetical protein